MIQNRSVPADILMPHIVYRDVAKAIDGSLKHLRLANTIATAIQRNPTARKCI
jgi:hypothetical protein